MKSKIMFLLLLVMGLNYNVNAEENYIRINPKIKLGKYENGNHFLDFVPAKFNWHINPFFSVAGGASVGFTAPRNSALAFNHYTNRLTVRATYRPLGNLGYFVESSWSNIIEGATNPVPYFRTGNYQAVGVEMDLIEFR